MAIDVIGISTGALDADHASVVQQIQSIRDELRRLREEMGQLCTMWEGPARQSFMARFEEDCAYMEAVAAELEDYAGHMEYASREYQKCESNVADFVAAVQI